jgi:hypothetical protein
MVIAAASGAEDRGFEPREGTRFEVFVGTSYYIAVNA